MNVLRPEIEEKCRDVRRDTGAVVFVGAAILLAVSLVVASLLLVGVGRYVEITSTTKVDNLLVGGDVTTATSSNITIPSGGAGAILTESFQTLPGGPGIRLGRDGTDPVIVQQNSDPSGVNTRTAGSLVMRWDVPQLWLNMSGGTVWERVMNTGYLNGDRGDITASADAQTWTIDSGVVTLAKMADVATSRFLGRTTPGTGAPEAMTGTQATALLDTFTSSAKGLAPASSGSSSECLRGNGTWAACSGGVLTFSGASVYNSTTQSTSNATWTTVTWDTEAFDTDAYHSTSSNTSRMTAPTTGYYLVEATPGFANSGAGNRYVRFQKNGSPISFQSFNPTSDANDMPMHAAMVVQMTAGDYVEVQVQQTSIGNLNVTGSFVFFFQITRLGA